MKKIYLLLFFIPVILFSCLKDEEDIFDTPALQRLYEKVADHKATLVSATEGWILDYYPERNQSSGGYAMIVKFSADGKASVACEIDTNVSAYEVATSTYDVLPDNGTLITFNTYNKVLHFFGDPSISDVDGMAGDYEFIMEDVTADKITLRGKKTGNIMYLRKFTDDNWTNYLSKVKDMRYKSAASKYIIAIDGKEYDMVNNKNKFVHFYKDEEGVNRSWSIPFICTPTGIRLYKPYELDGKLLHNFTYNEAADKLVSSDAGVNQEITFEYLPANKTLAETPEVWSFTADGSINLVQNALDYHYTAYPTWKMNAVTLGSPPLGGYGNFALAGNVNAVSRYWYVIYTFDAVVIGDNGDQIKFVHKADALNVAPLGAPSNPIRSALISGSPFNIKFVDKKITNKLIITSIADPNIYFTIQK